MEKTILIIADEIPSFNVIIEKGTTINQLKSLLKDYKGSEFKLFLNNETESPVFGTNEFDKLTFGTVWDQIENPYVKINTKQISSQQKFTGNKDVDMLIIDKVDDESLFSLCKTNKYLANICKDDNFWQKRYKKNFTEYHIKFKPNKMTWKRYYMETFNNKNNIYNTYMGAAENNHHSYYFAESPVSNKDKLIISHVKTPGARSVSFYYVFLDDDGNLISELSTRRNDLLHYLGGKEDPNRRLTTIHSKKFISDVKYDFYPKVKKGNKWVLVV